MTTKASANASRRRAICTQYIESASPLGPPTAGPAWSRVRRSRCALNLGRDLLAQQLYDAKIHNVASVAPSSATRWNCLTVRREAVVIRWQFDDRCCGRHNRLSMSRSLWRATVGLILVPYVALSSTFVPEHVHEADADHPHSTVHRHLEPHHAGGHDHGHAQLADDDGHVVWLDNVAVDRATFDFPAPHDVSRSSLGPVPLTSGWAAILNSDTAPAHGPPRASPSLRAPPRLSA